MTSSLMVHANLLSGSFCTLRGMTASRRPQTATYSDGPGRRESLRHAAKPTRSTKRSAAATVSIEYSESRCQRASRNSSISSGRLRGGRTIEDCECSMRDGVEQHVDANGIGIRRELIEILRVLALALPAVRNVRVVNHHDQQATSRVRNGSGIHRIADPAIAGPAAATP